MAGSDAPSPTIVPMGDAALLVRFGDRLTNDANRAAIAFFADLQDHPIEGIVETAPNLVSVLLRYDPEKSDFASLAGELRLRLWQPSTRQALPRRWSIDAIFDGPDLADVANALRLDPAQFIALHNASNLRVLATGFAPGFVYCGLHPPTLHLPRRTIVRPSVPAGSVLFAAGQTAITATAMPTGWHLIGRTGFSNFDPSIDPPTKLSAGDVIRFVSRA